MRFTPTAAPSESVVSNVNKSTMSKWRRAVARTRANVADSKILCLGDSTTAGQGAATIAGAYPRVLESILGGVVPVGAIAIPQSTGFAPADDRVVRGTGWTINSAGIVAGGSWTATTAAVGDLVITLPQTFDTITVTFWRRADGGTSQINVDGGANLGAGIVTAGADGMATATFNCAHGTHVINIKPPTVNTVWIMSVQATSSTTKRVYVGNGGRPGALASTYVADGDPTDPDTTIPLLAPDLSIISFGINDAFTGGVSKTTAEFGAAMATVAGYCKQSGDVILMPPVLSSLPPGRNIAYTTNEPLYRTVDYVLAGLLGYGVIDWQTRLGPHAAASAAGFMADTVHPNEAGYGDIAAVIYRALLEV